MDKPEGRVEIKGFPGMFSGVDVDDVPPGGSEVQVNIGVNIAGELQVRSGYRPVTFEA